ncbi:hypothetical protein Asppvi_003342 [Aspergillus pseudoviridinutans]|uniref:Uncharacterized protein n=1 Tax=Aspergillus pseudoviridinutans TaxID=1517512 RepID=A0A9P3B869_9EURO|nr:uncharacterized protein Asppvi_003342 [Aspergillus pseudoviridinutans]GIJ84495.1 hypothetical protein Asppvi_003342 [Aspergillus pseudoviridinutans]
MSTSKSSKGSKTSRITVACNSCRSRKQKVSASSFTDIILLTGLKCSGNRLADCQDQYVLNASNPIGSVTGLSSSNGWFPDPQGRLYKSHQARGPAKGYIEALEHRLHETEHVILRLLAHMSDEQLVIAVEGDQSPFLRSGKNDVQYWRRYPLRTARDLREWQRGCSTETRASPSRRTEVSAQSEVEADENSPVPSERQRTEQPVPAYERGTSAHEFGLKSTQVIRGKDMYQRAPWENGYDSSNELRKSPTARGSIYIPSPLESTRLEDTRSLPAGTPPGPSLWSEAPSVAFQQQFLW